MHPQLFFGLISSLELKSLLIYLKSYFVIVCANSVSFSNIAASKFLSSNPDICLS